MHYQECWWRICLHAGCLRGESLEQPFGSEWLRWPQGWCALHLFWSSNTSEEFYRCVCVPVLMALNRNPFYEFLLSFLFRWHSVWAASLTEPCWGFSPWECSSHLLIARWAKYIQLFLFCSIIMRDWKNFNHRALCWVLWYHCAWQED